MITTPITPIPQQASKRTSDFISPLTGQGQPGLRPPASPLTIRRQSEQEQQLQSIAPKLPQPIAPRPPPPFFSTQQRSEMNLLPFYVGINQEPIRSGYQYIHSSSGSP